MSETVLAARVGALHRSGIRAVMALAAQRERAGKPVIHLEVGQPDFPTPAHILDAACRAMQNGLPGYTPNAGITSLREAVAERVTRLNGRPVSVDSVCITSGAVAALQLALLAVVEPGDEVLIPDPGWPNYRSATTLAGGVCVPYPLNPVRGFAIDLDALAARISARSRVLMLNSPGNPTGAVFTAEQVASVLALAEQHGLYVLSDEVYEDLVFGGARHASAFTAASSDRVILVSGASKSYAMTGWRIGWLVAHPALAAGAAALVEPQTSCPATIAQVAAEAALRGPQDAVGTMRDAYGRRAQLAAACLEGTGLLVARPSGAFYAMLDIARSGLDSSMFVQRALEISGVAVAPGSTFGAVAAKNVRVSLASSDDAIREGLRRLADLLPG